jgi:hypothetical protein
MKMRRHTQPGCHITHIGLRLMKRGSTHPKDRVPTSITPMRMKKSLWRGSTEERNVGVRFHSAYYRNHSPESDVRNGVRFEDHSAFAGDTLIADSRSNENERHPYDQAPGLPPSVYCYCSASGDMGRDTSQALKLISSSY